MYNDSQVNVFDYIEKTLGGWWTLHIYLFPSMFLIGILILAWRVFKTRNVYENQRLLDLRTRVSFRNYPNLIRCASMWVCFAKTLILYMNPYLTRVDTGEVEWLRLTWVSTFPFMVGGSLMLIMFSAEVAMIYARARPLLEPKHLFVVFSMLFLITFCIVGDIMNMFEKTAGKLVNGKKSHGTHGRFSMSYQSVVLIIFFGIACLFFCQAYRMLKRRSIIKNALNPTPSMAPLMVEEGGQYPLSKSIVAKQLGWFALHMVLNGMAYLTYCAGIVHMFAKRAIIIELRPKFVVRDEDEPNFWLWYIHMVIHRSSELLILCFTNWSAEFVNYNLLYTALLHKTFLEERKEDSELFGDGSSEDVFAQVNKAEKQVAANKERSPAETSLKEQVRLGTPGNKALETIIASYSLKGSFKLERLEGQEKELIPTKWRQEGIDITVREGYGDQDD